VSGRWLQRPAVRSERHGQVIYPEGSSPEDSLLFQFEGHDDALRRAQGPAGSSFETMTELPIRNRALPGPTEIQGLPIAEPSGRGGPERHHLPEPGPPFHDRRTCAKCASVRFPKVK
jgi:hypothetical protein